MNREDAERRAWVGLRALVLDRGDRRRQVAEALGISFQRVKALRLVAETDPPLALHELAAALVTDKPYTTVIVRDLAAPGLGPVSTTPRDGRSKIVRATPAGPGLAGRAAALMNAPPAEFAALTDDDLAALERIVAVLSGMPDAG